jgi:ABC-type bacteriocin/lantibiotic exporter with double-glycine peptidase domain
LKFKFERHSYLHQMVQGGVNDYRVAEAQMKLVDMLSEAPEQDSDAIKVAEEALKVAIELRNITSEGKRKGAE